MSRIGEYFDNHKASAPLAVGFLGLAVLAVIVLPVMTYAGKYSATMQKFMKTAVKIGGHDAGQNWMWVAGGAAGATAVGLTSLAVSLRNKKTPQPSDEGLPQQTDTSNPAEPTDAQPPADAPVQPNAGQPANSQEADAPEEEAVPEENAVQDAEAVLEAEDISEGEAVEQ